MDRKISRQAGFTFVEVMLVVAIVGIVAAGIIRSNNHARAVASVNDDLHSLSLYFKKMRLDAFTQKTDIQINIAGNSITSVIDPGGAATAGRQLVLRNTVVPSATPFNITPRGNINPQGNIQINPLPVERPKYSCIVMSNIRVRLGTINGANCDAI